MIGTIVGIGRIIFSTEQYSKAALGWNEDRLVQQVFRGTCESLLLGPILLIYDLFFVSTSSQAISSSGFSFAPLNSAVFTDHAAKLVAFYATKPPPIHQLREYQAYLSSGTHAWSGQPIFNGADFYMRHGIMHASFVAMFIPVFIALYRRAGHPEVANLRPEDIVGLQVAAFLHDYGRIVEGKDLIDDNEQMENLGANAAYHYLKDAMGFSEERSKHLSDCITDQHVPLLQKSLLKQVLHSSNSLAVLRADDWCFDPSHLDFVRWVNANIPEGSERHNVMQELYSVIDSAKRLLVEVGDSPFSMPCFSQNSAGQIIAGNFSIATKRTYEKSPQCYSLMLQRLRGYPALGDRLPSNV